MINEKIKTGSCPAEDVLNSYLTGILNNTECEKIEKQIAACPYCIYSIAEARSVLEESGFEKTKGDFMDIAKKINVWFLASIVMFVFSFIIPQYFIQFVAAAVICGVKWIVDNKNTKMLILIYEAWKQGGEKEAEKIIKTLDSRMKR